MLKTVLKIILQYFRKLDKTLFIAVCGVSGFSVLLMYSIVRNGLVSDGHANMYKIQFVCLCAGAFAALVLSAFDYHKFVKLWFLYAPAAVGLTLLTFTSLAYRPDDSADDVAWINLGFTTLQPSEVLKIAFVMTFALHLSKVGEKINNIGNVALLCIHGAVPTLIVVAQGDDGTALVFFVMFVCMMFAAGISWKYILPCIIAAPIAVWVLWDKIMLPHQKLRFLVLFEEDPMSDPEFANIAYQQYWGKLALGSGQLFGKGLFADEYVSVPYMHNDFIFTYVGQCFGFIGCIALLSALTFICLKILINSRIAKDDLGKYICIGVFAMMFIHCVLNLGMVLGVMPVIGVPLPFVSQGGTSMASMFVCIGLVMSTYSHSEKNYRVFYDAN
ncbi:MAG: FtsW/RodA/SpoVE family cell cycle protein [Ruminococcus sp.]|nr:FtsW/RodA/SpoVE family cell cycle protein [Ruminococcus sp.]MCM1382253.1 FtsW/RodA/SpoVE family cell cycle protein [Muribaculaceae bacterium]